MIKKLKITLVGLAVTFSLLSCGEPEVVSKEQASFDKASQAINTNTGGVSYGNTEEAKALADDFATTMKAMQAEFFTGGKKNRTISATKDNFLTYCQLQGNSVVFLVHVPQFKKYKGEVRDSLNELAWLVATGTTAEYKAGEDLEIVVAMKGSILYGASCIGKRGGLPETENEYSIDTDKFHKYFKSEVVAAE